MGTNDGEDVKDQTQQDSAVAATQADGDKKSVVLDADTYNSLLDHIADLEELATGKRKGYDEDDDEDHIERLAREGARRKAVGGGGGVDDVDINDMTNEQLTHYILSVGSQPIQQLQVAVETLKYLREIDKAETKHEDFRLYEKDIQNIAIANPTLSIEEAYQLAKSQSPAKGDKGGKDGKDGSTRTERLFNLPPRQTFGEKPSGIVAGATRGTEEKTISIKDAANDSWNEMFPEGKK
jgi:hypothetical protein